ncbi:MAG TPA: hypothetical protein VHB02_01945 [Acidimicrobiales bacterium]|nr:hypothetical protein [Acidimicrobiales bacterium]
MAIETQAPLGNEADENPRGAQVVEFEAAEPKKGLAKLKMPPSDATNR